jgi:phospholipase/carboxylesterase
MASPDPDRSEAARRQRGELAAHPHPPLDGRAPLEPGVHRLPGAPGAAHLLLVPQRLAEPAPLVVLLHGAGGSPAGMLPFVRTEAEARGVVVLAPKSGDATWDVIRSGFGADVGAIDAALEQVFDRLPIDPARIVLAGFSDGASYALSLGLQNGGLFSRVVAFSPGFLVAPRRAGRPSVFVSHGVADRVLPIDRCSRRLVPALRSEGYDVDYREFPDGHEVPPAMVEAALAAFAPELQPEG